MKKWLFACFFGIMIGMGISGTAAISTWAATTTSPGGGGTSGAPTTPYSGPTKQGKYWNAPISPNLAKGIIQSNGIPTSIQCKLPLAGGGYEKNPTTLYISLDALEQYPHIVAYRYTVSNLQAQINNGTSTSDVLNYENPLSASSPNGTDMLWRGDTIGTPLNVPQQFSYDKGVTNTSGIAVWRYAGYVENRQGDCVIIPNPEFPDVNGNTPSPAPSSNSLNYPASSLYGGFIAPPGKTIAQNEANTNQVLDCSNAKSCYSNFQTSKYGSYGVDGIWDKYNQPGNGIGSFCDPTYIQNCPFMDSLPQGYSSLSQWMYAYADVQVGFATMNTDSTGAVIFYHEEANGKKLYDTFLIGPPCGSVSDIPEIWDGQCTPKGVPTPTGNTTPVVLSLTPSSQKVKVGTSATITLTAQGLTTNNKSVHITLTQMGSTTGGTIIDTNTNPSSMVSTINYSGGTNGFKQSAFSANQKVKDTHTETVTYTATTNSLNCDITGSQCSVSATVTWSPNGTPSVILSANKNNLLVGQKTGLTLTVNNISVGAAGSKDYVAITEKGNTGGGTLNGNYLNNQKTLDYPCTVSSSSQAQLTCGNPPNKTGFSSPSFTTNPFVLDNNPDAVTYVATLYNDPASGGKPVVSQPVTVTWTQNPPAGSQLNVQCPNLSGTAGSPVAGQVTVTNNGVGAVKDGVLVFQWATQNVSYDYTYTVVGGGGTDNVNLQQSGLTYQFDGSSTNDPAYTGYTLKLEDPTGSQVYNTINCNALVNKPAQAQNASVVVDANNTVAYPSNSQLQIPVTVQNQMNGTIATPCTTGESCHLNSQTSVNTTQGLYVAITDTAGNLIASETFQYSILSGNSKDFYLNHLVNPNGNATTLPAGTYTVTAYIPYYNNENLQNGTNNQYVDNTYRTTIEVALVPPANLQCQGALKTATELIPARVCVGMYPNYPSTTVEGGQGSYFYVEYRFFPTPTPNYQVIGTNNNPTGEQFIAPTDNAGQNPSSYLYFPTTNNYSAFTGTGKDTYPKTVSLPSPYEAGPNAQYHYLYRGRMMTYKVNFNFEVTDPKKNVVAQGNVMYYVPNGNGTNQLNCYDKTTLDYVDPNLDSPNYAKEIQCRQLVFYFPSQASGMKGSYNFDKLLQAPSNSNQIHFKNPGYYQFQFTAQEYQALRVQQDYGYDTQGAPGQVIKLPNGQYSKGPYDDYARTITGAVHGVGGTYTPDTTFLNHCVTVTNQYQNPSYKDTAKNQYYCFHDNNAKYDYWTYDWSNTDWYPLPHSQCSMNQPYNNPPCATGGILGQPNPNQGQGIPQVPSGLKHSQVSTTGWIEQWTGVTGASGYNVYIDGKQVATTSSPQYTFTNQTPFTTYTITVAAINAGNGVSGQSSPDYVYTGVTAPAGLNHSNVTASGWKETWGAIVGATGYNVYLNGTKVANSSTPSYTFTNENPGKTYSVTVTALSQGMESKQSAPDSVTTNNAYVLNQQTANNFYTNVPTQMQKGTETSSSISEQTPSNTTINLNYGAYAWQTFTLPSGQTVKSVAGSVSTNMDGYPNSYPFVKAYNASGSYLGETQISDAFGPTSTVFSWNPPTGTTQLKFGWTTNGYYGATNWFANWNSVTITVQ